MNFALTSFLRNWYKFTGKSPANMEMVEYWKYRNSVPAKVTKDQNGALVMKMEGEKEIFPGFPRGYLLFGVLSKLKHEIKDQVFNDAWKKLEEGKTEQEVAGDIKSILKNGIKVRDTSPIAGKEYQLGQDLYDLIQYEMVPPQRMVKSVREIHRAWTAITDSPHALRIRDILTFILQEDDSYRFRVQWIAPYMKWFLFFKNPVAKLEKALTVLEHAEVISDMKLKIRLLRRILLVILHDEQIHGLFLKLCREIDWKKVALSKADKYHFRGKYFKVDLDLFEY